MRNFWETIKWVITPKYKIIETSFNKYVPMNSRYVYRKDMHKIGVKQNRNCMLVYDIDNKQYHNVYIGYNGTYSKGSYVLMQRFNDYYTRIAKCVCYSKDSMPDLFDGHETPGIGYMVVGILQ